MKNIKKEAITKRENEVLEFVCKGYNNTEISKKLWISPHTAKAHVKSLLRKFKAKNRTHLAYLVGLTKSKNISQD
jgi:DNA-binding CsgD family transcriptional regulator